MADRQPPTSQPLDDRPLNDRPLNDRPLNNRPLLNRFLVSLAAVALALAITIAYMAWPKSTPPRQFIDHAPEDSLTSPLGMICHAHSTIAKLQPSSSNQPVTLFSVLRLDHTEEPFYPPDKCAYPYNKNYRAARRAITDAWAEVTDKYDGHMLEWRDAFSAAAMVLLNDTTRIVYTKEVLPKIKAKGEQGWREICNEL